MQIGNLSDIRRRRRPATFVSNGLVLGPELITNGNPLAAGGWTVGGVDATHIATFASGQLRFQSDTTSPQIQVTQIILTVGKVYRAEFLVSSRTGVGTLKTDALGASGGTAFGAPGSSVRQGTATQTTFNITRGSANVDVTFDSISVREVISQ